MAHEEAVSNDWKEGEEAVLLEMEENWIIAVLQWEV